MPVVSDTSPLLNLAIIDRLDLLRAFYAPLAVPEAVVQELRLETDLPGSAVLRSALERDWLHLRSVQCRFTRRISDERLHAGERAAVAFALQQNVLHVSMDEREGRQTARRYGLRVTGVLGVLLRAKAEGRVGNVESLLKNLREEADFWISDALWKDVLRRAGERYENLTSETAF
jgi:predicted nucleic acid-binding protein